MISRYCAFCGQQFQISEQTAEICGMLGLPLPEICFEDSIRRQACYRNLLTLFRRKSDKSGRSMISIFPPESPYTVYHQDEWFGDDWDPMDYGREVSLERSLLEQFAELQRAVPVWGLQNTNTENAEYCTSIANSTNCYLAFGCYLNSQDIYCSYRTYAARDVFYSLYGDWDELCFYVMQSRRCYACVYCDECFNCTNCAFSYELEGCSDCLFCSNLRSKRFYVGNQPYSEEDYRRLEGELDFGSKQTFQNARTHFAEVRRNAVHRAMAQRNSDNCSGHHLTNCNDCEYTFEAEECERLTDCLSLTKASLSARCFGAGGTELCYECSGSLGTSASSFSMWCYNCYDCHYCFNLHSCKHCFGCSGLRNKEYCVMNRQYSKEHYQKLTAEITARMGSTALRDPGLQRPLPEWGSFFLPKYSLTGYNTSHADIFFPMQKAAALKLDFLWHDEAPLVPEDAPDPLPDHIRDWPRGQVVLRDPNTGRQFSPPARMLEKFKQANVWLVDEHPTDYLMRRLRTLSYRILDRRSALSGAPLQTVYSEQEAPLVYTNEEYLREFS